MSTTKAIIISSVPKYVGKISSGNNSIRIPVKTANSLLSTGNMLKSNSICTQMTTLSCASTVETMQNSSLPAFASGVISTPSKRRRLEHLTLEEKLQRKKLKNRVAAQCSRDRKKARMDVLEVEVNELKEKNALLSQQCRSLQSEKEQLAAENVELRRLLSQAPNVACSARIAGPAESLASDPLPQGRVLQGALCLDVLLKILLTCLHYQTCLESWTERTTCVNLKLLQTAYFRRLQKKWKENCMPGIQEEEILRAFMMKWWGRHQKTWNPMKD